MTGLSRRAVLGSLLTVAGTSMSGALLTACTGGTPAPLPTRTPTADERLRARVASQERSLAASYDLASAALPALAVTLAPYTAAHRRHADALAPAPSSSRRAGSSTSPLPRNTASASPTAPADRRTALAALADAETAAAAARLQDVLVAADSELARLLASIGTFAALAAARVRSTV